MDNQLFIDYLQHKRYSNSSITKYCKDVSSFIKWMEHNYYNIHKTSYNVILYYLNQKRSTTSSRTRSSIVGSLKLFFDHLIDKGVVKINPTTNIRLQGVKQNKLYTLLQQEELDELYQQWNVSEKSPTDQRNKVVIGLIVYQGLTTGEVAALKTGDIEFTKGIVTVPSTHRSNSREINLQAVQVIDLVKYINLDRLLLLQRFNKQGDHLILSAGKGYQIQNIISQILPKIQQINPKISSIRQIRISVITLWLKKYNIRQVQYLCGHRWISSTESYKINDIEQLTTQVKQFHPF